MHVMFLQALFVTRVQLLHVFKTLENAAYEVLPAEQPGITQSGQCDVVY